MKIKLMKLLHKNNIEYLIYILLILWVALFIIRPTDIGTGDLGRHIKNGEIIMQAFSNTEWPSGIFYTNFYSYTHPDFPFTNHHWASGLIFYIIFNLFGIVGLQVILFTIILATITIIFYLAIRNSNLYIATTIIFFMTPILTARHDLRPEIFSYLFLAILLLVIDTYRKKHNTKVLYALPLLFFLWANIHIYFIFGFFILAVLLFQEKSKKLTYFCLASILTACINPFGPKLLIYPFTIFGNYGISVKEAAPILKAIPGMRHGEALIFFVSQATIALVLIYRYTKKKTISKYDFILSLVFSVLAWIMIRNITMYSIVIVPILSFFLYEYISKEKRYIFSIAIICLSLIISWPRIIPSLNVMYLGIIKNTDEAANFIIKNNISGPLLNDFNSGGYAELYLFPKLKLFIDNRPEAFPESFSKDTYDKMFLEEDVWKNVENKYNPNMILLRFGEAGPKTILFIASLIEKDDWIPIFVNRYHIIFVKKNEQNAHIIQEFEIPKTAFRIET